MKVLNKKKENNFIYLILGIAICLLVAVLPQVNNQNLANSTISSKTIFFIYSLIIVFFILIVHILFFKKEILKFRISKIEVFLFLLICYFFINRYILQTHYGFSFRFIELIGLCFFYLTLRILPLNIYIWLFLAVMLSGIVQAVYGNLQLLGYYTSNHSGFKITGSFFNPGPYAGFLVSVWTLALGFYLFKKSIEKNIFQSEKMFSTILNTIIQYVPLLTIISVVLVLPATQSRASWLAVFLSSIILLDVKYRSTKKILNKMNTYKKVILIVCTVVILSISLFGIYHFKKSSSDGRLFIWKVSTEIIKENSLFGVGFDRFKANYMNYQANYFAENGETKETLVADNTYYVFNEFLQFIVENGFIGCILLLCIVYYIINCSIVKGNVLGIIIKVSLLSIGAFSFFSYAMEILPIKIVIVVLIASLANLDNNKVKLNINPSKTIIIKTLSIVAVLVISIFSISYINRINISLKNWQLALHSYQFGNYESAIQEYKEAYPELKNNGDFLMSYGKALSIYKQNIKAIEVLEQAKTHLNTTVIETALGDAYKNIKLYDKSEIVYKHAANMIPSRFYPLYLLTKLYDESEQRKKAITMAKNILNKQIKIPSTAIEEIRTEIKKIITKKPLDLKN